MPTQRTSPTSILARDSQILIQERTACVNAAMNACGSVGAKVINMSLEGDGFFQSFNDAAKAPFQNGVLLIAPVPRKEVSI